MAVIIVKKEPNPQVLKFKVCYNCGVELSYVPNDVKSETHYDYGGGSDRYDYIDCPNCNKKVEV